MHAEKLFELHGKVPRRRAVEQSDMLLPVTLIRDADDVMDVVGRINERATTILKRGTRP